ncbi:MAG TPA: bifunctional [glutamine synthetase] adenylyltransferase/[glutamine synthetase]-adenylyl-L-tyrosine phosphorylase [Alphaproteobacteria bacterium]|nr:bifunctional [glutamine synthetase] adenylyltransferase/[glutamine synthetase]-adenylyl-L-tyrosine phosphorylase [Alphaproteobacteria bacterium]
MPEIALRIGQARLPRPGEPDRAQRMLARWLERAADEPEDIASAAQALLEQPLPNRLLTGLFGSSPFLGNLLVEELAFATKVFWEGPGPAIARALSELGTNGVGLEEAALMRALRLARRRVALGVAIADMAGDWDLARLTGTLSSFAEQALRLAVSHLLGAAHQREELILPHLEDPERASGYILIAMGKLGAGELNYSSDIDLIALYDPDRVRYSGRRSVQDCFVRMTQGLVRLLQDRTVDGYAFRVDLRLRPDPASTPAALSLPAAEAYYESMGQNWERAAMIKARPIAGDIEAGGAFLSHLKPYVWRRHLDFAAIRDIHSIKRQIHAHKGHKAIAVGGHNIKLGRGGIREIEFFAQTQQLIWGGRMPDLRLPDTCGALAALARAERIGENAARTLIEAYRFLRQVEHRLQMIDDSQTQTLPSEGPALEMFARFMGFEDTAGFGAELVARLRSVEKIYAELFEEQPDLSGPGNLVFTGTEADPETVKTLERMGFSDGVTVSASIRGWHHGRYRATRSTRARELLTELMPQLLQTLARTGHPDEAFARFDAFLANLPAGVPLFSMIGANPELLDLIAEILGGAPRLARQLSRKPQLLDAVLTPGFGQTPPRAPGLADELGGLLGDAEDYQEVLDLSRRWLNDRTFQIGVGLLRHLVDVDAVGRALSDIADVALNGIHPFVARAFAEQHGTLPGPGLAVLALGKLGGREMTVTSDLDLIFLYEGAGPAVVSSGPKPLSAAHYQARLSQRLINAYTAQTEEGLLYEVDMRLRPSGNAGPIAVSLEGFLRYQENEAWTWEHMALTRARVIVAEPEFRSRIEVAIRRILTRPREPTKLAGDVAAMRRRMQAHNKPVSIWDVKQIPGGLIDVEFVAQYLMLLHGARHPGALHANTGKALKALTRHGLIGPEDAATLMQAGRLWRGLQGYLRLATDGGFDEARAPEPLRLSLARVGEAVDFAALMQKMDDTARQARAIYERIVEAAAPAQ